MEDQKLIRTNDRIFAGVCAAFGKRYKINENIVRLIVILLGLALPYIIVIAYIIIAYAIPVNKASGQNNSRENFKKLFNTKELPKWFVVYSFSSLYPILFWPLIAFASIFMFDNPDSGFLTFLGFIAIVMYPIALILIIILGFRLYKTQRIIAYILPLIPILAGLVFINSILHLI